MEKIMTGKCQKLPMKLLQVQGMEVSIENAQKLLGAVKDANKYTEIEKVTMKYISENYKFTDASVQWFRTEIQKWAGTK